MKDYTKYNFAAIVGAEVEIKRQDLNTFKGTLVMSDEQLISVMINDIGVIHYELKENILSLTAKIKVEDMSLKQITRHAEILKTKNGEKEVYFMVNSDVLPNEENKILFFGTDTIGDRYRTEVWLKLSDTIDCTDWGREHE